MEPATTQDLSNIALPNDVSNEYKHLITESQLDWLLKTRHKNGLSETGAVLKVSGKLYINKPVFIDWFMNQKAN